MTTKNKFSLTIGDWSDDGHGKYDDFVVVVNKELKEIQEAYRNSCEKSGFRFHNNDNKHIPLLTEYQEYAIKGEYFKELVDLGFNPDVLEEDLHGDYTSDYCTSANDLANIMMWFISLSLEDFEYEFVPKERLPAINGWWGDLNHQFGYGIYE